MPSKFYNEITEEGCNKLRENPTVNPLTKRRITSIQTIYTMLLACKKKFGHPIPEHILRAHENAKVASRKSDWEEGLREENMKYAYAVKWGERWDERGVGHGSKISRAEAKKEEDAYYNARRNNEPPPQPRQKAQARQAPAPAPKTKAPASPSMSKKEESAVKRLQYCKKLSAIALAEKDNAKFIDLGMELARRYGYADGEGRGRIHLRKAMQLVCHPDKYINTLTPSKQDKVTEYIQIINSRLDKLK